MNRRFAEIVFLGDLRQKVEESVVVTGHDTVAGDTAG